MRQKPRFVGTTILAVRRDENVVLAGDGQVTLEQTQVKGRARKVRRLADGSVLAGFAGGAADAFALLGRFEEKLAAYQHQLELITSIQKQIEFLDNEIPGLWRDFYSWDDPFYRDGVIKPQLDEAMENRQKLEVDLQEAQAGLDKIQADARQDGAEPGWFRGFDMPPTPRPTAGVVPR